MIYFFLNQNLKMFDLKYFDELRKEKEYYEKTFSILTNPYSRNKIKQEMKSYGSNIRMNQVVSQLPNNDYIMNLQILYQLYGEEYIKRKIDENIKSSK